MFTRSRYIKVAFCLFASYQQRSILQQLGLLLTCVKSRTSNNVILPSVRRNSTIAASTPCTDNDKPSVKQDFFNFTSARWIYNEKQQLEARHVQFSIPALKEAAEKVAKSKCIEMIKLPEGLFNRVFLLKFSNGEELIVRIPTPIAGPNHWTTASEVATLKLMEKVGVPVPKVLAYSCQKGVIGCEYIIMEKARGELLEDVWDDMSEKRRVKFIAELIDIEKKMLEIEFGAYGSVYMREDVNFNTLALNDMEDFQDFRIGPSVNRAYWRSERQTMDIDRGPWNTLTEYMSSIPKREIQWIEKFAKPRSKEDLLRRSESQESPQMHIDLLSRWLNAIPYVAAKINFQRPSILHMNLHDGNIFVANGKITSIIDWQGTDIRPLLFNARFPCFLDYDIGENPMTLDMPQLPANIEEFNEVDKAAAYAMRDAAKLKKYWLAKTYQKNRGLADAIIWKYTKLVQSLHLEAGHSWEQDIASFRHVLIKLSDLWKDMGLEGKRPVFTEGEIKLHEEDIEEYNSMVEVLAEIEKGLGLSEEGRIANERFEDVMVANEEWRRQMAKDLGEGDEKMTEEWYRWWPFADRE